MQQQPTNPYYPIEGGAYVPCAFAGRTAAYSHINQHFADPRNPQAAAFVAGSHRGKSALLWHFQDVFDDAYIGVYLPLRQFSPAGEDDLLQTLISEITNVLRQRTSLAQRLPDLPTADSVLLREWFQKDFLPVTFQIIRPHRRLMLLLDDIDMLLERVQAGAMPTDLFAYLSDLLATNPQLGMAFTLHETQEPNATKLAPLTQPPQLFRLDPLPLEETALLMAFMRPFTVTEEATANIYRATGGLPLLLQRVGYHLYEHMLRQNRREANPQDVKAVLPTIVQESDHLFQQQWNDLTLNEQLVLSATSHLLYDNPIDPVTPEEIETWLVETDYPLDDTTVKSALRGLEYHDLVKHQGNGVYIPVGIWQTWLLNHAKNAEIVIDPSQPRRPPKTAGQVRRTWIFVVVGLLIVLVVVLAVLFPGQRLSSTGQTPPPPTVTLDTP